MMVWTLDLRGKFGEQMYEKLHVQASNMICEKTNAERRV